MLNHEQYLTLQIQGPLNKITNCKIGNMQVIERLYMYNKNLRFKDSLVI